MNEKDYPWRTSNYGDWSGLRLNAYVDPSTKRPKSSNLPGILVGLCIFMQFSKIIIQ